jgi:hypothetical protein
VESDGCQCETVLGLGSRVITTSLKQNTASESKIMVRKRQEECELVTRYTRTYTSDVSLRVTVFVVRDGRN